jgi:hypothetical protein
VGYTLITGEVHCPSPVLSVVFSPHRHPVTLMLHCNILGGLNSSSSSLPCCSGLVARLKTSHRLAPYRPCIHFSTSFFSILFAARSLFPPTLPQVLAPTLAPGQLIPSQGVLFLFSLGDHRFCIGRKGTDAPGIDPPVPRSRADVKRRQLLSFCSSNPPDVPRHIYLREKLVVFGLD